MRAMPEHSTRPVVAIIMGSNSALLAAAILANEYPPVREALRCYRETQTQAVLATSDPRAGTPDSC
jgi:phosphoribosylcarboxyaminoimidazole (NCAIR) mutase